MILRLPLLSWAGILARPVTAVYCFLALALALALGAGHGISAAR
jgi:hypothetical protein